MITITITNEEGEVLGTIENVEEYDLDKTMARASLINDIKEAIDNA